MTKTVVSIEDDPQIADLIKLLLAAEELTVHHYANGEEGLQGVLKHRPDLVILDVMIPGMTGWEVHQRIREHETVKETPIMILSVTQQTLEQRLSFKNSKIDFYLSKPFEVVELRRQVNEILNVTHWQVDGKLPETASAARTQIKPIRDLLLAAKKVEDAKRQAVQANLKEASTPEGGLTPVPPLSDTSTPPAPMPTQSSSQASPTPTPIPPDAETKPTPPAPMIAPDAETKPTPPPLLSQAKPTPPTS
jgi:DNA-binding response OmpR family regulator